MFLKHRKPPAKINTYLQKGARNMRNPETAEQQLEQAKELLNDFCDKCVKMQECAKALEPALKYANLAQTNNLLQKEVLGFLFGLTFVKEVAMCESLKLKQEEGSLF